MRERRQQVERPPRCRHIHLSFEGANETFPLRLRHRRFALRYQFSAGREVGKPNIEPVVERIAFLSNTARRMPHGPDSNSLSWLAGFTQADNPQGHGTSIPAGTRAGLFSDLRPAGPMSANG